MAKEGIPFIVVFAVATALAAVGAYALGAWWLWGLAAVFAAVAVFMAYFFRDPERTSPGETDVVVSPADGKVMVVERVDPSDRSPIAGVIEEVVYKPGRFKVASRKIASAVNEQNVITIAGPEIRIVARQIAGLLARRIVCWKEAGDRVGLGERIGLMKFSSRMDVVMGPDVDVLCKEGDRVVGGVTVIGRKRR
jgi:phosphatidylserine decarboxylase